MIKTKVSDELGGYLIAYWEFCIWGGASVLGFSSGGVRDPAMHVRGSLRWRYEWSAVFGGVGKVAVIRFD